jgi:hypothetical protein
MYTTLLTARKIKRKEVKRERTKRGEENSRERTICAYRFSINM